MSKTKKSFLLFRIFDAAVYVICICIIIALIGFLFGITPYITMSGSMEPAVKTGSLCFVNMNANYENVKEGDIIAFSTGLNDLVTHRVIKVTEEGFETKGDNNDVSDGISTTPETFKGKTLFSIPYIGYILKYLQQPVYMAMIAVIVIAMLAICLVDSYFERKK